MNSIIISPLLYSGVTVFLGKLLLPVESIGLSVLDLLSLGIAIFFIVQILRAQLEPMMIRFGYNFNPGELNLGEKVLPRSLQGQVICRR